MHRTTGVAGALVVLLCGLLIGPSAVGAAAATTTAATAPAAAATTVWRADGYGPGNTGYNPVETAINTDTIGTTVHAWSIISPVIRYSCSRQSPPVVANDKLYLTDQGGIAAYNATTGARLWTYRFPNPPGPADQLAPNLTVVGSRLIADFTGCRSVSDPSQVVRALDANTGAVLWTVFPDLAAYYHVVDKDVVVLGGDTVEGPMVAAYRLTDGALLWSKEQSLDGPVSANGRLLLGHYQTGPGADLVDIRTGAVLWTTPESWSVLAAGPTGGPLFARNAAGELARINVETGAVVWRQAGAAGEVSTDGTRLYVAQADRRLVVRDAATGAQIWSKSPFTLALGKPVIAGGVLYLTVNGAGLRVYDAATGLSLDDETPYAGATGHPVVVNGRLYVTTGRLLDAYVLP